MLGYRGFSCHGSRHGRQVVWEKGNPYVWANKIGRPSVSVPGMGAYTRHVSRGIYGRRKLSPMHK